MKQSPVTSPSLQYVVSSYREWLDILGYAASTVESFPNHLREFFHYIEERHQVTQVQQIRSDYFTGFYEQLKTRTNVRQGGALSNSYLNKYIDALTTFVNYLHKSSRYELPHVKLDRNKPDTKTPDVLTVEEVMALFKATELHPPLPMLDAIEWRDKAVLTVVYSCGLRCSECYALDVSDINLDTRVLHVRKGKNYKERLVPFNQSGAEILQTYIYDHRPYFNRAAELNALFVSAKGFRMGRLNTGLRLKSLIQRTELVDLKEKHVTLHTLRHSIATHLLHAGMPLEKISRFLGHSSIESTQLYTHLVGQLATGESADMLSSTVLKPSQKQRHEYL